MFKVQSPKISWQLAVGSQQLKSLITPRFSQGRQSPNRLIANIFLLGLLLLTGCVPKVQWLVPREEVGVTPAGVPAATKEIPGFRVQIASLGELESARQSAESANTLVPGVKAYLVEKDGTYKIRLGDCRTKPEAQTLREQLIKLGYADCWITQDMISVPAGEAKEGAAGFTLPPEKVNNLRVGILVDQRELIAYSDGNFGFYDESENNLLKEGQAWEMWSIVPEQGRLKITSPQGEVLGVQTKVVVLISKEEGKRAGCSGRLYRGKLKIFVNYNGLLNLVNLLNMDEYLYGVVPSEMGVNKPLEALKAQAIVARSECLAKEGRHENEGFDLCADVHCQVYGGVTKEHPSCTEAVNQTKGLVVMSQSQVANTVYHACCGGWTETAGVAWPSAGEVGYLVGIRDFPEDVNQEFKFPLNERDFARWVKTKPPAYCDSAPGDHYRWERVYTKKELEGLINKTQGIGELKDIKLGERGVSGRLKTVDLSGTQGTFTVGPELKIRQTLGNLRSAAFILEKAKNEQTSEETYKFSGAGWGHGVGLCQEGAMGRAEKGQTAEQILKTYYPGITIEKIY